MAEKSKNDQSGHSLYRKIAAYGRGVVLLIVFGLIGYAIATLIAVVGSGGFAMGPGSADFCMSTDGVHHNFKMAGWVIDEQDQPVSQAHVELGSNPGIACVEEATLSRTVTNESGEFSFASAMFAYRDEFFISVSADGCHRSIIYKTQPPAEPINIALQCSTN